MNKHQAMMIVEAHEIDLLMNSQEEVELLRENNPDLLDAYRALLKLADWEIW